MKCEGEDLYGGEGQGKNGITRWNSKWKGILNYYTGMEDKGVKETGKQKGSLRERDGTRGGGERTKNWN